MVINNKKLKHIKSGFTLVELIAVIAILAIVIATAYSINAFGINYFYKGDAKSNIQSNLRNTASYISKEIRYSSNAKILGTSDLPDFTINPGVAGGPEVGTSYIYVTNGKIKKYSAGVSNVIFGSTADNIMTTLGFDQKDYETVHFNLQAILKGQTYSLDSSIILLNIGDGVVNGVNAGVAISYKPGQAVASDVIKLVTLITANVPSSIKVGDSITLTSNVEPINASIKDLIWSVDSASASITNSTALTASTTATIIGKAAGTVNVIAIASDGSGVISAKYPVTVTQDATPASSVTLTANLILDSSKSYTITKGSECILTITISPNILTTTAVKYIISGKGNKGNISTNGNDLTVTYNAPQANNNTDEINAIVTINGKDYTSNTITIFTTNK